MTVIFGGIDFPVLEIVFVVSLLLFFGLIAVIIGIYYIIKEFRLLKDILQEEEADIERFESDLQKMEKSKRIQINTFRRGG